MLSIKAILKPLNKRTSYYILIAKREVVALRENKSYALFLSSERVK
jgi:hypothetical protein